MTAGTSTERRMLTASEFATVARSHYPALNTLPRAEAVALAEQIRALHVRAGDVTREQRRENRGRTAAPRAAAPRTEAANPDPAPDERGMAAKKQVFAAALKRLAKRIERLEG